MPKICRYGFILKAPGYNPLMDQANLKTVGFDARVIAVSTVEEACAAAKELVADGVELIELSGGFGKAGVEAVIAAIDCPVPVGYVEFSDVERKKLDDYLME